MPLPINRLGLLPFVLFISMGANANSAVPVTDLGENAADIQVSVTPLVQPKAAKVVIVTPTSSNTNANAQLFDMVEMLQYEVQNLRGQVEELTYNFEKLKQDQKQRYLDLDRRIVNLLNAPTPTPASQVSNPEPALAQNADLETTQDETVATGNETIIDPVTETALVINDPVAEKAAYNAAFALIKAKQFDASINALQTFVSDFPHGVLVGNAHYWLGEVHMVQGDASLAVDAFELVISSFPNHRKIPHALYKLGVAYQNLGNNKLANKALQRVLTEYPDSSAARLAHERVN